MTSLNLPKSWSKQKLMGENNMTCNHETEHLMGTAEGIVCTACGATFKEWDDVIKARGEKPVEAQEKPKKTRAKKA